MKILLDTHILLWFQGLDKRMSKELREEIEYGEHDFTDGGVGAQEEVTF